MDSDDVQVGRLLGRREMLEILGASGAGAIACSVGRLVRSRPPCLRA